MQKRWTEMSGFELPFTELTVQQKHLGCFLKMTEPSTTKDQNHMGRLQGHHLGSIVRPFVALE